MEVKSLNEQKSLLATLAPGKRARLAAAAFRVRTRQWDAAATADRPGIEHGPRDFFSQPGLQDPEYQFRLAAEAGYSAIACQIGLATKYYPTTRARCR